MVLATQSAVLSILSVFVLIPKGFAFSCIQKNVCVEEISVIDCSEAGLESTPQTKKRMVNYTVLSLRDSLLLEVNFTWLMEQFPDLKTVDLRNNAIYCEDLGRGWLSEQYILDSTGKLSHRDRNTETETF